MGFSVSPSALPRPVGVRQPIPGGKLREQQHGGEELTGVCPLALTGSPTEKRKRHEGAQASGPRRQLDAGKVWCPSPPPTQHAEPLLQHELQPAPPSPPSVAAWGGTGSGGLVHHGVEAGLLFGQRPSLDTQLLQQQHHHPPSPPQPPLSPQLLLGAARSGSSQEQLDQGQGEGGGGGAQLKPPPPPPAPGQCGTLKVWPVWVAALLGAPPALLPGFAACKGQMNVWAGRLCCG